MAPQKKNMKPRNSEPGPIMGRDSFANMPESPIFKDFSEQPELRGGLPNSFTANIEEVSGIRENKQSKYQWS